MQSRSDWAELVRANWAELAAGGELVVPLGELAHPGDDRHDWTRLVLAEPAGQLEDWALSCPDGSRIHVHVHADAFAIHRDRWDPSRGLVAAAVHYLQEAPSSRLTVRLAGLAMLARAVRGALGR